MYNKITWNDLDNIINDEIFEKCLDDDDESYIKTVILEEIEHLKSQGIEVIKHNTENDYIVIKKPDFKIDFKVFPTNSIYDCDQAGNLKDRRKQNSIENNSKILTAKAKVIIDYFSKQPERIEGKYYPNKNIIIFSCPICGKTNDKMHMWVNSFIVGTKSQTDCTGPKHEAKWKKYKNELTKIWNNSKEKRELVYSLNIDYIENIINKHFPSIIRHAGTKTLFMYDKNKKHYIEMIDNSEISDIENLIYSYFFNENDEVLTSSQLRDVKNFIKKNYKFTMKYFESSDLINLKNGILDIKTNEFKTHSDNYFFNYKINILYNPEADSSKLDHFIKSVVTMKNPITIVKNILGHVHYQGTKLQKGFLFKGTKTGRNGKGTLVKLIETVIGATRTVTMNLNMLEESTFSTYNLKDKALYVEDDYKLDYIGPRITGFLNRLISQAPETVHQKNKPAIEIRHTAVPIIQCNKVPKLKAEDDGGFYKRWFIVHFDNEYGDESKTDEFLGDKLLNDVDVMSSMLNYLVEGYNNLINRKENNVKGSFFSENDGSFIADWKKENNSVLQFIDDCCELNNSYSCSSRELWKYYRSEWNLGGMKLSETKFVKMIKEELNLNTNRKSVNGRKLSVIEGIKCIEEIESNFVNLKVVKNTI